MTDRYEICLADDLEHGDRLTTTVAERSIGVFNVGGEYFAIQNTCPHMGAPLCEGRQTGTGTYEKVGQPMRKRSGEIIRCPWHGWEFDIETGESTFNPHRYRAQTFQTTVETPGTDSACTSSDSDVEEQAFNETDDGSAAPSDIDPEEADARKDPSEAEFVGDPPIDTFETAVEDDVVVVYI